MPADTSPEILHSNASSAAACPSSVPSAPAPCSCTAACDYIGDGGDIDLLVDPSSTEGYVISDGGDIDTLSEGDDGLDTDIGCGGTV